MSPSDRHPAHSRKLSSLTTRQKTASAAIGTTVVVIAVVIGLVATSTPSSPQHVRHHLAAATPPLTASSSTLPPRRPHRHLCPLTGEPAHSGTVPPRPAIGVKIGNDPASRPQSGLQVADIVYEEMAEGGITRYLAVYQCREAAAIGPVRSVRWDDWHVLASYRHPILAFSGGIDQWDRVVSKLHWLYDANGSFYPQENAYYRTSNRQPPWNYYTSTAALWKLDSSMHSPPPPQFAYGASPPAAARPARGVTIVGFSSGENVVWRWSPKARAWERFYGSQPDIASSGQQLHATNVVVEMVHARSGPYAESGTVLGTDSITKGTGITYVLRDGRVERGTWHRPAYRDPVELRSAAGAVLTLQPGNTWVELVPTTYVVQVNK
ncbi:MAG: DUF3048 domain-containing protein [Acidimicrobiales bacterium]